MGIYDPLREVTDKESVRVPKYATFLKWWYFIPEEMEEQFDADLKEIEESKGFQHVLCTDIFCDQYYPYSLSRHLQHGDKFKVVFGR